MFIQNTDPRYMYLYVYCIQRMNDSCEKLVHGFCIGCVIVPTADGKSARSRIVL